MWKEVLKGIASSERVWLTIAGIIVLGLSKAGVILPDEFTKQLTELIMVLVASLGLRPVRPKTTNAKLEEAVAKAGENIEKEVIAERAKRISLTPPMGEEK